MDGRNQNTVVIPTMLKHEGLCTTYGLTKWLVENCLSIDRPNGLNRFNRVILIGENDGHWSADQIAKRSKNIDNRVSHKMWIETKTLKRNPTAGNGSIWPWNGIFRVKVIRWIFGFGNGVIYWSFRSAKGSVVRLIISNNYRLIIMMEPLFEINTIAQCDSDECGTSTRVELTREIIPNAHIFQWPVWDRATMSIIQLCPSSTDIVRSSALSGRHCRRVPYIIRICHSYLIAKTFAFDSNVNSHLNCTLGTTATTMATSV